MELIPLFFLLQELLLGARIALKEKIGSICQCVFKTENY